MKILAAVDFSGVTDAVVQTLTRIAATMPATIRLVHVAPPDPEFVGYEACWGGSGCSYRSGDGIEGKSKKVYEWVPIDGTCKTWKDDCKKVHGEKYFMKLALWGEDGQEEVPAPATLSLFGLGLLGLGAAVRRRRKAA